MDKLTIAEEAYKRGYEKGLKDAVNHSKWNPQYEYDFEAGMWRVAGYNCDECGIWNLKKSNYCPNCGAKMDGGAEDG